MPHIADKEVWGKIINSFGKIMEKIEVVSSAITIEGKMGMWMDQYLEKRPAIDKSKAYSMNSPFVENGFWYVFSKPFSDWAWQNKGQVEGLARSELNLKRIGASNDRLEFRPSEDPKKRIQFRAWRIPHSIATPPPILVVDNTKHREIDDEPIEKVLP